MKNWFRNLDRIEFEITNACTGKCKHCSQGDHGGKAVHINGDIGAQMVRRLCQKYKIESLMTFGGEPLLDPMDVFKIQSAARDMGIPKRHIITNGFFSRDEKRIKEAACMIADSGVNYVMLSVDAFHQETIPLDTIKLFAKAVLDAGVFIKTHPAWLVSREDENRYNIQTKQILSEFLDMGIAQSNGNVIFPSGNAIKYLGEYFDENKEYINPYEEKSDDIHTVSVSSDGSVLGGNINEKDIFDIMDGYEPSIL